jgi:hypothetical protein
MAKLKVPSLQHLARIWHPDPLAIKRTLVGLTKHGPTFSYEPLYGAVRDLLRLHIPYEQVAEGIRRFIKHDGVRANFLDVLPLIREHFDGVSPDFVQDVTQRFYPVGRGIMIPFKPPLIYGTNGQIHFPWFSFWRSNPLTAERLSLFVTIVDDVLLQDPDLEDAKFEILDFSAPKPKMPRHLNVVQASTIPRVSESKKVEMLSVFAEGYRLAQSEIQSSSNRENKKQADNGDEDQLGLF